MITADGRIEVVKNYNEVRLCHGELLFASTGRPCCHWLVFWCFVMVTEARGTGCNSQVVKREEGVRGGGKPYSPSF